MAPGDLVRVSTVNTFRDERGGEFFHAVIDPGGRASDNNYITVPTSTIGVLLEVVPPVTGASKFFAWARVLFPQGVGHVSDRWVDCVE